MNNTVWMVFDGDGHPVDNSAFTSQTRAFDSLVFSYSNRDVIVEWLTDPKFGVGVREDDKVVGIFHIRPIHVYDEVVHL